MRVHALLTAIGIAFLLIATNALAESASAAAAAGMREHISVAVEGAGPDVILIPGLASSREVWSGLAARLRQSHRLHLVQVAGFAGSPAVRDPDRRVAAPAAQAIAAYIEHERIKAPAIIGHSLGGAVALMLGARYPNRVGRLVIVDALPFYSLLFNPAATSETARPGAAAFRDALLAAPDAQAQAMQSASIDRLAKSEAARPALVTASIASDRRTVADASYELMTTDLRPELGHISAPVTVIYAYDAGAGIPAAQVDAVFRNAYATAPNTSFKRIDDSRHFVMLDQPALFERTVIDVLGQEAQAR
ncbi:alpha/beta fold hydrolase [Comamonas thiooxydans]|uniref:alpha/beta fold hydrolase n=1 Tax=Comamonas thiooxydans TaxID=363952 RepID=UPI0007C481D7|nr:alpha/beta hydrolase [Comamonas thiooxydans]MCO8249062.1 alpha/beta hydrolase [Comamonas thiooxydans]OAD82643.1 alpha/beta hydrolase [Comamonas thiooxydans]UBQ41181.1 alpha/beta hydrolase [Comamonas thiooxydans]